MKRAAAQRAVSAVIALAGLCYLGYALLFRTQGEADSVSSILTALLTLLGVFGFFAPPRRTTGDLNQIIRPLRAEMRAILGKEARRRRLLGSRILPMALRSRNGERGRGSILYIGPADGTPVTAQEFGRRIAALVTGNTLHRAVIHGATGGGKTTLALLMARGLLEGDSARLPVLLSMASWDPAEPLDSWLGRQIMNTYESARAFEDAGQLLDQLVFNATPVFVFDGLDELPRGTAGEAMRQISDRIPAGVAVIVLCGSRRRIGHLPGLGGWSGYDILRLTAEAVHRYLAFPATAGARVDPGSPQAEVLSSPLYLSLFHRLVAAGKARPEEFLAATDSPPRELRDFLIDRYVEDALSCDGELLRSRDGRHLGFLAYQLHTRGFSGFSWWRVHEAIPPAWMAMLFGLTVGPAYQLALQLPDGLTRGFAIGTTTGVILGATRGMVFGAVPAAIMGAVSGLVVFLLGRAVLPPGIAVVDAVQCGTAIAVVAFGKAKARDGVVRPLLLVAAAGTASAAATVIVQRRLLVDGYVDRRFTGVLLAVALGVGVAVLAARLLVPGPAVLTPARVGFRLRRGVHGPRRIVAGVVAAVPVGLAGGITGAFRHDLAYGAALAFSFGLMAGVPVGVVGGLVSWAGVTERGGPRRRRAVPVVSPGSLLRDDVATFAISVVGVGLASTLALAALLGPMSGLLDEIVRVSELRLGVEDGLLFGLTIGVIVASFNTACLAYFMSLTWFVVTRRLPWRFIRFADRMCAREILRREGVLYQFRNDDIKIRLAHRFEPRCRCEETGRRGTGGRRRAGGRHGADGRDPGGIATMA
ncbi:hypothetical protein GCM10010517_37620 [Streptosporangium fragile]|uniref:NACHT domain-containing protein n=1 Tax=Streptosporangium fragile TaxID=46186 RepID=A0ABN3VZC7_9ACTN